MTYDDANLPHEVLAEFCGRALENPHDRFFYEESFYLRALLPDGKSVVHRASFLSPEQAAAALVLLGPLLERVMPLGTRYEIVYPRPLTIQ